MNVIHESTRREVSDLIAFATIAEERNFTRAAARLGVSQSALSHLVRGLEKRLGVQLLARTTRSVSPTPLGDSLLQELRPALDQIQSSVSHIRSLSDTPSGRIRLIASQTAAAMLLLPKLADFQRRYPGIAIDVTISNDPVELVAGEYDAGIQIGEFIQKDMIAVRASLDQRLAVVATPNYFARYAPPKIPEDLKEHSCVGIRLKNSLYRWEFSKGKRSRTVNPQGLVSFDDPELCIHAVQRGIGIGIGFEEYLQPLINEGKLVQVLKDWCQPFPGFFLYYPSRRNQPAALAALIATLRLKTREDQTHKPVRNK